MKIRISSQQKMVEKDDFSTLLTVLLCLAYVYTQIMTFSSDNMTGHVLWLLWFSCVIIFHGEQTFRILKKKEYIWFYLFSLFYFFTSMLAVGVSTSFNRLVALFEVASPILMYSLYRNISKHLRLFLLVVFSMLILFNAYILIDTINQFGFGLKIANQGDINIVNAFNWTYSWVLLSTTFALLIFNKKIYPKKSKKTGFYQIVLFLLGVSIVIRSLFMTAILSLLLGVVVSYFFGRKYWLLKSLSTGIVASLFFVYTYQSLQRYVGIIQDTKGSLSERFEDVYNTLAGNNKMIYDLDTRNDLYNVSLTTFGEYPITGINHKIKNVESVKYVKVGNHSEWLDNLALYGLFSFFLFLFLLKSSRNGNPGMTIIFIVYVFIGFFNPLWYFLQNFILFFYIPLFLQTINSEKTGRI